MKDSPMVDTGAMQTARERQSTSNEYLAINSGQRFHTKEMLNSARPDRYSLNPNVPKMKTNPDKTVLSPRSQRQKGLVSSFQNQMIYEQNLNMNQGLAMDQLRKLSSSQMQSVIKTPKAESTKGGLKNSVLNFFKFDSFFGRS